MTSYVYFGRCPWFGANSSNTKVVIIPLRFLHNDVLGAVKRVAIYRTGGLNNRITLLLLHTSDIHTFSYNLWISSPTNSVCSLADLLFDHSNYVGNGI